MDNKKLLWTLNVLVCVVILLQIYSLSWAAGSTGNTATGGSVNSTISVGDSDETTARRELVSRAKERGYFTASEFAIFEGVDKKTVYRRLETGVINDAEKVNGRWRIFCD